MLRKLYIGKQKQKKTLPNKKKRSRKNRLAERKRVTVTSTTRSTTTNSSQLLRNYSMLCHHQKMNRIDVGNRTLPSTINVRMLTIELTEKRGDQQRGREKKQEKDRRAV
ncbi:unnamed protein product [Wuchereria bancrofti]|uniref:Uncharacterized protein n=1 Tax=Wuchereria bancrofti TaxID=6293 RepID=A0A3P7ETN1_WUCBA|nr:unnamed protein product [Wuchereria bancrofti]